MKSQTISPSANRKGLLMATNQKRDDFKMSFRGSSSAETDPSLLFNSFCSLFDGAAAFMTITKFKL